MLLVLPATSSEVFLVFYFCIITDKEIATHKSLMYIIHSTMKTFLKLTIQLSNIL